MNGTASQQAPSTAPTDAKAIHSSSLLDRATPEASQSTEHSAVVADSVLKEPANFMGAADNFGFPELVPDPEREELFDPVTHIRYCFLMTNVAKAVCDFCGSTSIQKFGTRTRSYRDLPKLQDRTVLVIKRQRFRCPIGKKGGCGRVFFQGIAGLDLRRSMTTRCLEWIRANCLYFTNQQAADHIGCNIRTFWDISNQRIKELKKRYKPYTCLL